MKFVPSIVLTFCLLLRSGSAQVQTGTAVLDEYSLEKKVLLNISTAQFISILSQGSLDEDSALSIARTVTKVPYSFSYLIRPGDLASIADKLIDNGQLPGAKKLVNQATNNDRIRGFFRLADWYLHRPGLDENDLDQAAFFLQEVKKDIDAGGKSVSGNAWSVVQSAFLVQTGQYELAANIQIGLLTESKRDRNLELEGVVSLQLAKNNYIPDTAKQEYLENALAVFHRSGRKEKEIEVLNELSALFIKKDIPRVENLSLTSLAIQRQIGFQHSLFANYLLSHSLLTQAKYLEALKSGLEALDNMKWSKLPGIGGTFYMRVGATYGLLGKQEDALSYFRMGYQNRGKDIHLFWYKSVFYAVTLLVDMGRTEEAVGLLNDITSTYPPANDWEQFQVLSLKGYCYESLGNWQLADYNYSLLAGNKYRNAGNIYEESETYVQIANFYLDRKNSRRAREFTDILVNPHSPKYPVDKADLYRLLYRLDSLEGKFRSALENHIHYTSIHDSISASEQRKDLEALNIKYAAEKKDKDILLLKKSEALRLAESKEAVQSRNIWVMISLLMLFAVGLIIWLYLVKQKANRTITLNNHQLQQAVQDKDWLVKEIHHRVKNNFQIVMGLLGTQSSYLTNQHAIDAIAESNRRIRAMSLIHQKLYQSDSLSRVRMPEYLQELASEFVGSIDRSRNILFKLNVAPVSIGLATCIPVGLLVNEAITNSIKYAFPDNREGVIQVSLKDSGNGFMQLCVADNGVGLPDGFDINAQQSMGVNLMRGLSAQIGSQFSMNGIGGTTIMILIPEDPEGEDEYKNKYERNES